MSSAERESLDREMNERAEQAMTPEQKIRSDARAEGFEGGRTEKKRKMDSYDKAKPKIIVYSKSKGSKNYEMRPPEKPFREAKEVNGIRMHVGWDSIVGAYTIVFPDMKLGEGAEERGVYDASLYISLRPDVAKQVFDFAAATAEVEPDLIELYLKVEKFADTLPRELDEKDEFDAV